MSNPTNRDYNSAQAQEPQVEAEATTSVDLSKLFSFNPTALELALKTIISRLNDLEAKGDGEGKKDGARGADGANGISREELADLKDKLADHNNRLNDLENPKKSRGLGDDGDDQNGPSVGGWGDRKAKELEDRLNALEESAPVKKSAAGDADADGADAGDGVHPLALSELSKRVGKLEEEGATKAGDVQPLQDRVEDLEKKMADMQKQIDDLNDALGKKADKDLVDDIDASLQDAQRDLEKAKENQENNDRELENLRNEHGKMQGRLGTLEGLTTLLNSKGDGSDSLGKELNSFSDTLGDIKAKQAEQMADIEALQLANKNLEKAKDDLEKEKQDAADAERKNKSLEDQLGDLKKQIRDLEDATAKRGKTSPGAEDAVAKARAAGDDSFATKPQLNSLGNRLDDLEKRLEGLSRRSNSTPPAAAAGSDNNSKSAPSSTGNNGDDLNDLKNRLAALEDSFDAFRKEARGDIGNLQDGQASQKKEISALGTECSKLSAELSKRLHDIRRLDDTKANKSDIEGLRDAVEKSLNRDNTGLQQVKDQLADTTSRMHENARNIQLLKDNQSTIQGAVGALQNEKAGKDMVGHLAVDVADLGKKMNELAAQRGAGLNGANAGGASEEALKGVQDQINEMIVSAAQDKESTKGQLLEIRATVEHIHQVKADSHLVANKAERDYVENAMEKLMREVEQVLNTTNSGLIDTIDKSLNILRDMIDGKATKDDVNSLKKSMSYGSGDGAGGDGTGNVPDGLTGYKGYRCLGCNRTMEGMRQRPMGNSFNSFMNRVPASTRVPKPPGGGSAPGHAQITAGSGSSPAGYLTGPPGSA